MLLGISDISQAVLTLEKRKYHVTDWMEIMSTGGVEEAAG